MRGALLGIACLAGACTPPAEVSPSPVDTGGGETGSAHTGAEPGPAWVQVTVHPCALDELGRAVCWTSPTALALGTGFEVPPPPFEVSRINAPGSIPMALHAATSWPVAWHCPPHPIHGTVPPRCETPDVPLVDVGGVAGLTPQGSLVWWVEGNHVAVPVDGCPADKVYTHFAAPYTRVFALASDNSWCAYSGAAYHYNRQFPPHHQFVKIAPAGYGLCALDVLGEVVCDGAEGQGPFAEPVAFTNPPYRDIAGGTFHVCAVEDDWTIVCNDGSEHHFGPIRTLAVGSHSLYDPATGEFLGPPTPREGLGLCVITEDNAIRCVGQSYYADLLDQLPTGDGASPRASP